ncbi:hypothetical protein JHK85_039232 [Glycine max]|nr:hypothetical protein JHK85_039232 [Glycine max]
MRLDLFVGHTPGKALFPILALSNSITAKLQGDGRPQAVGWTTQSRNPKHPKMAEHVWLAWMSELRDLELVEKFSFMNSKDVKGSFSMLSFEAAKIRLLRSLIIQTETMQHAFPDKKIDCGGIVHTMNQTELEGKSEVIILGADVLDLNVWLELICKAVKETDESQIFHNLEAQHRYLTWRAEKDPGRGVLKKLIGDTLAKDMLRSFLFNGVDELGSKTFNDYFPQYCCQEGNLNKKGNIIGKSFENRPWNARGEFIARVAKVCIAAVACSSSYDISEADRKTDQQKKSIVKHRSRRD